jgi:predicted O-linked N-acetylglucosamine transferase (SPINDLY family)
MQNHIDQLIQQAFGYIQNGNFDASEPLLKNVIQLKPKDFNANNLLGVIYIEKGMPDECISHLKKALKIEPNNASANYNMANALMLKEQHSQALSFHTKATQLNPNDYWTNTNYGISLFKLNQLDKAKAVFQKAINLNPEIPGGWVNLANCLKALGQSSEALTHYERSLTLDPQYTEAWFNVGVILFELKRHEDAVAAFGQVVTLKPDHYEAWSKAGATLEKLKRYQEALTCYDKAINSSTQAPELIVSKGNILRQLKRFEEALDCYERALELLPNSAECLVNKGNLLVDLKHFDEAIVFYQNALALKPNIDYLLGYIIANKMLVNDWHELDYQIDLLLKRINLNEQVIYPFPFLATSGSPALQLESAKIWVADKYPQNHILGKISKTSHNKIRVGYFSADFKSHPTSHLTAELYELHDRNCFEVYSFSLQAAHPDDEMRKRLVKAFDHFIDVENKSDQEIAQLARELEIDIAIDLGGHTQDAKTGIFAYRAAPIQVNYLGYPGTMGAEYIDYIVADKTLIPEADRAHYSEKIIYLNNCFQANDRKRYISAKGMHREQHNLPAPGFIYCCFNNNYKITPEIFKVWMNILNQTKDSVLWILAGPGSSQANLIQEAKKFSIDPARLIFADRLPPSEYLERYQLADLFLDTLPFNSGTTASDALWAGLPVLTQIGQSFAGRMAASLLNAIELPELITHTQAEYEALAIELAINPEKLQAIKEKLAKNRLTTPLFNTPLFTENLERAYTRIYQRYQAGLAPDHLVAE